MHEGAMSLHTKQMNDKISRSAEVIIQVGLLRINAAADAVT